MDKLIEIGRLGIHQMIRLDSSGNDTSDSGVVGTLIILRLLYPYSCSKWFFLVLAAWCVRVFCLVAFSDRGTTFRHPHSVYVKLNFIAVGANRQPTVSESAGSVRSD